MSQSEPSIRNVNAENLVTEIKLLSGVIDKFPFVSLDTEFPGTIYPPENYTKIPYENLKRNVNATKLIQLGLTLSDPNGNLPLLGDPPVPSLWQFNFSDFNIDVDLYKQDSIELLKSSGIDFKYNLEYGAPISKFIEHIMTSGLVCNEVTYITFSGIYDYAYLIKALTGKDLPNTLPKFLERFKAYFGENVYDIKEICKYNDQLYGGLKDFGKTLGVERFGNEHQAGSDSLLTMQVYRKIIDKYFWDESKRAEMMEKCAGVISSLDLEA